MQATDTVLLLTHSFVQMHLCQCHIVRQNDLREEQGSPSKQLKLSIDVDLLFVFWSALVCVVGKP